MRTGKDHTAIRSLLEREDVLTVADFMAACPGLPAPTVSSRIRALVQNRKLYGGKNKRHVQSKVEGEM